MQLLLLLLVQVHNAHPWTDQHGRKVCRSTFRDVLWSWIWPVTKNWRAMVDFLFGTCLQRISGRPSSRAESDHLFGNLFVRACPECKFAYARFNLPGASGNARYRLSHGAGSRSLLHPSCRSHLPVWACVEVGAYCVSSC